MTRYTEYEDDEIKQLGVQLGVKTMRIETMGAEFVDIRLT